MKTRCFLSFLLILLVGVPASAQVRDSTRFERLWQGDYDGPRRLEIGVSAGYALSTDWTDLVALHVFDTRGGIHRQVLLRNVAVAPGAGGAVAVTYWRGRHGFRATAGYSKSCLTTSSRCVNGSQFPPEDGAALGVAEVSMDVWRYGVEGIVGLRNWRDSQFWRPYLIVGVGGVAYDPDEDELPLFPGTFETLVPPGGTAGVVITNGASTLLVATEELGLENVFGLTVGVGMDLRAPVGLGGVALRFEFADQITSSPFSVTVSRLDDDGDRCCFDHDGPTVFRAGAIHNLRATAGVAIELPLRGPRTETDPWDRARRR